MHKQHFRPIRSTPHPLLHSPKLRLIQSPHTPIGFGSQWPSSPSSSSSSPWPHPPPCRRTAAIPRLRSSSSEARTPAAWAATAWSACTRCSSGRGRSGRPGRTRTSRCSWPARTATAWGSRTCPPGAGSWGRATPTSSAATWTSSAAAGPAWRSRRAGCGSSPTAPASTMAGTATTSRSPSRARTRGARSSSSPSSSGSPPTPRPTSSRPFATSAAPMARASRRRDVAGGRQRRESTRAWIDLGGLVGWWQVVISCGPRHDALVIRVRHDACMMMMTMMNWSRARRVE